MEGVHRRSDTVVNPWKRRNPSKGFIAAVGGCQPMEGVHRRSDAVVNPWKRRRNPSDRRLAPSCDSCNRGGKKKERNKTAKTTTCKTKQRGVQIDVESAAISEQAFVCINRLVVNQITCAALCPCHDVAMARHRGTGTRGRDTVPEGQTVLPHL